MKISTLVASALTLCTLGAGAFANTNNNEPGSLLVYPLFENDDDTLTIVTVTNTNTDVLNGTVRVEFIYINGDNCLETNKTRTLTANDSFTIHTGLDNPNQEEGYLYVFAKGNSGINTNKPIKFDYLIGTAWLFEIDGEEEGAFEYDPIVYSAANRIGEGGPTDTDNDGIKDLNGLEYEQSPDQLLVPRFFGQIPNFVESELILINLTGGKAFDAIVDFLIYNDNEEVFSAQYQFRCWEEVDLSDVNGAFDNEFLLSTGHASGETSGLVYDPAGPNNTQPVEAGWYRMDGNVAFSTQASFPDPAILALHIESLSSNVDEGVSELELNTAKVPFSIGSQSNGDLLPLSIFGDLTNN